MARSNAISPGRGAVASIKNSYRSGKVNTYTSETSGNTNKGRPGLRVEFGSSS